MYIRKPCGLLVTILLISFSFHTPFFSILFFNLCTLICPREATCGIDGTHSITTAISFIQHCHHLLLSWMSWSVCYHHKNIWPFFGEYFRWFIHLFVKLHIYLKKRQTFASRICIHTIAYICVSVSRFYELILFKRTTAHPESKINPLQKVWGFFSIICVSFTLDW